MPLTDCPFTPYNGIYRPTLQIRIVNPTKFDIFDPLTGAVVYTINDTPIDFLPNLHLVLLGVKSFLSNFVLNIDYPRKMFSVKKPK